MPYLPSYFFIEIERSCSGLMKFLLAVCFMALPHVWVQENGAVRFRGKETVTGQSAGSKVVGQLTRGDVLSIKDGQFFLEGERFAEIGFNKFDLFWQLYDQLDAGKELNEANPLVQDQDKALRDLHELGFRTIRVFALPWGPAGPESYADPEKRKNLYAALDKTLELCDAHDIRVVWSLGAGTFTDTRLDPATGWIYGEEHEREQLSVFQPAPW
jgi:hypothetical protein